MRFIESTSFFVRTIVFDFKHRNTACKLRFRLVPMIHIGSADYYEESYKQLSACDEILYEGAHIPGIQLFSNEYKRIAHRVGLVTQLQSFNYQGLREKLTHTDYDKESGRIAWNRLNWIEKLRLLVIKPLKLRIQYYNASRRLIAKAFMPSNEEAWLAYGPAPDVEGTAENLMLRSRDNLIINAIKDRIKTQGKMEKLIGIMYGAGHMKFIANFLTRENGFFPQSGEFVHVFTVQ